MGFRLGTRIPFIAAEEDTGPIVKALIDEPSAGKVVLGFRERIAFGEFLHIFTQVTGYRAEGADITSDRFKNAIPVPELQLEVGDNIQYFDEFGYEGGDPSVIHPKDVSLF